MKTRYDGKDCLNQELMQRLSDVTVVTVCPEELGGLSTPRPRAEIEKGSGSDVLNGSSRVMDEHGRDVTALFIKGAKETLKKALSTGAAKAYLKEKSPSCGVRLISRNNETVSGAGVSAALLMENGIEIIGVE